MTFKGKQPLSKVVPNHPFAKPQIGFVKSPRGGPVKTSQPVKGTLQPPQTET